MSIKSTKPPVKAPNLLASGSIIYGSNVEAQLGKLLEGSSAQLGMDHLTSAALHGDAKT